MDYKLHIILDCTHITQVKLEQLQNQEFHCERLIYSLDTARYKMFSVPYDLGNDRQTDRVPITGPRLSP